nr:transposase [Legionella tucsonensis]
MKKRVSMEYLKFKKKMAITNGTRCDDHIYKERSYIERFFNRIKRFRRVATRYDKTAAMFLGALTVISILLLWLKV